ncbi:MAG: S41 family peptidase [Kiloniellales bacterium]
MSTARLSRGPLAAALAAALLLTPGPAPAAEDDTDTYRYLQLLGSIFERVRADYVEEKSDKQLIESAIQGMLNSLDPHSSYLNERSFSDMQVQTKGEFGGLGIEVTMENGFVKVVSPIDDTPAYRAGLKTGDYITHLDGDSVQGLALAEAVEKMRGQVNTDIVLTIRRENREPFDVTITRDIIRITPVRRRVEGKMGYLRITAFNEQTEEAAQNAIEKLKAEIGEDEILGLVIDLRNNPGGLLDQAVAVSDLFLEQGEIVSTRGRDPEATQRFNARAGDAIGGVPIVVLINGGSASASEIVAGALQDHQRAIVMGTRSFGKGSVQTIIPQRGQVAIRLTTALYYTPSGRSIQATGIEPDIVVEQARLEKTDQVARRRERDLRGALGAMEDPAEEDAGGSETSDAAQEAEEDYQLARALDLLRGISLYRERAVN